MKIVLIHGQNHKGSTYHISRMLAEKINGEITEFFLPKDLNDFCLGCTTCFIKGEDNCPHYNQMKPITTAIDEADLIILDSPVYVMHATAPMKNLLDHYGYRWMVHRPEETMFKKQAVCISTAAGAGMKRTNKDMADSLFYWGVCKIYSLGYAVAATSYDEIKKNLKARIDSDTSNLARKIMKRNGKIKPGFKTKMMFRIMRLFQKKSGYNQVDVNYWKEKGWLSNCRPWK